MSQLEAHEVALHKVFSSDYDFSIPDYQRPYAWKVENARQLLEDLEDALVRGDGESYFLGSVVLVKPKDAAEAHVIDGQQRLTTLTILLAVLRDLTEDSALRTDIEPFIAEPGSRVRGLAPKPRLTLRPRDSAFFRSSVQTTGAVTGLIAIDPGTLATDAQRAVRANAEAIHGALSRWSEQKRLALLKMLSDRTFLVVVSTADLDSAHRIFSVMNARGLDLSPADIFKSKVVGSLPAADSDRYSDKWEDAEESLGREGFADLFLHVRVIFARERAKKVLLKEFQEQVLAQFLPARAAEFVDEVVVPYARAYETVRDQSYSSASNPERVNRWLRRLAQVDNNDWRPPALWALRYHEDDPVWLDRFFRSLERLAASMLLRRVYATPRSLRYADLLRDLSAGLGLEAPSFTLNDTEKRETVQRLQGEIYLTAPVRKYVLLRLDEVLARDPGVTYEHKIITVEHVLPQNPQVGSNWLRDFSDEERSFWTHRLGNLVLLNRAKNSEAQNFDFLAKKQRYFTSRNGVVAFALTSQVLRVDEWTPESLTGRQEELVGRLSAEWAL